MVYQKNKKSSMKLHVMYLVLIICRPGIFKDVTAGNDIGVVLFQLLLTLSLKRCFAKWQKYPHGLKRKM